MAFSFTKIWNGLKIKAKTPLTADTVGDLEVNSADGKLNYHNGTTESPVVTESHAATLTSKTIAAGSNTISGITNTNIAAGAAIDATKIAAGSVDNTEYGYLDGVTSSIQTQLNTISGSAVTSLTGDVTGTGPGATATTIANNAITNIKVAGAAAISRSKLASGTANRVVVNDGSGVLSDAAAITANRAVVSDANGIPTQSATSDTEIGYVAGVTSSIQTQLNNKQPLDATLTSLAAFNSNGLVTQTAADTFTSRTVTGTASQITVTNGSGVAGNPTVAIATDPVLPGTGAVQIPSGTTAQRPGSPVAGDIRYNTDLANYEGYTTAWSPIAGSGGGINYIAANDGSTTTGWATYADAAGTAPVDGTGGSPNVTWTTTASSPLRGASSFLFTKDAANRQGQGVSYDFTIASADGAAPSTVNFAYQIASGTYADGDLAIYIVDTTTGEVKQPSAYRVLNATLPVHQQPVEFQLNTGLTYRLCIHVASTSAVAYTVKFDDFSLSPTSYSTGASTSDWTAYTISVTGSTSGFGKGTIVRDLAFWRRVGDSIEIKWDYEQSAAGASGSGQVLYSLPSGLSFDSAVQLIDTTPQGIIGSGEMGNGGNLTSTASRPMHAFIYDATHFSFISGASSSNNLQENNFTDSSAVLPLINTYNNLVFSMPSMKAKIQGWGTNQVLSSETDTRIVVARYHASSNQTTSSAAPMNYLTMDYDSHGAVTVGASWKFTAPVSGYYEATVHGYWNTGTTTRTWIYKNGVQSYQLGDMDNNKNWESAGSATVQLNAGEYIDIRPDASFGSGLAQGSISISRVSGPAQIAASETIAGRYYLTAGSNSPGADLPINYDTKDFDTHNAVTVGAAWKFTAPRAGFYNFQPVTSYSSGTNGYIRIWKNGVAVNYLYSSGNVTGFPNFGSGSILLSLKAGDYVDIRPDQNITVGGSGSQTEISFFSI